MMQIYRANAKLQDLVTRDGRHTGMEFGFLKSLEALRRFFNDEIIVCWEGRNNFRYKIDSEYKANRRKKRANGGTTSYLPLDFERLNKFKELVEMVAETAFHDELEADDIIASLAEQYCQTEKVIIYSGDKDLLQLVRRKPHPVVQVKAYQFRENPWNVGRINKEYNGLQPNQLALYLAMVGDTSDNIPGSGARKPFICSAIQAGYSASNMSDYELFSTKEIFKLEKHYTSGRFDKNLKLVTLQIRDDIVVKQRNWQPEKIAARLNDLEFMTLDICKKCGIKVSIQEEDLF